MYSLLHKHLNFLLWSKHFLRIRRHHKIYNHNMVAWNKNMNSILFRPSSFMGSCRKRWFYICFWNDPWKFCFRCWNVFPFWTSFPEFYLNKSLIYLEQISRIHKKRFLTDFSWRAFWCSSVLLRERYRAWIYIFALVVFVGRFLA